jgi:hypothetical protein
MTTTTHRALAAFAKLAILPAFRLRWKSSFAGKCRCFGIARRVISNTASIALG